MRGRIFGRPQISQARSVMESCGGGTGIDLPIGVLGHLNYGAADPGAAAQTICPNISATTVVATSTLAVVLWDASCWPEEEMPGR